MAWHWVMLHVHSKEGTVGRGICFRSMILGGAVAAVLGTPLERALATDRTWTNNGGAGGFAWGTAGNWSPAGVPGAADKAILSNTAPGALDLGGVQRTIDT